MLLFQRIIVSWIRPIMLIIRNIFTYYVRHNEVILHDNNKLMLAAVKIMPIISSKLIIFRLSRRILFQPMPELINILWRRAHTMAIFRNDEILVFWAGYLCTLWFTASVLLIKSTLASKSQHYRAKYVPKYFEIDCSGFRRHGYAPEAIIFGGWLITILPIMRNLSA